MKLKHTITMMLLLTMVLPLVQACSSSPADQDKKKEAVTTAAEETGDGKLYPQLPSDAYFNNDTFTFLISSNDENGVVKNDITAEEINGDPINDARYKRNTYIEDTYGIEIKEKVMSAGSDKGLSAIRTAVLSNSADYDAAFICGYAASELARGGMLYDLNQIPYLDLTQPWWDQKANEDLMIYDMLFYTTGDISTASNDATYCIYFNKDLVEEYNLTSPYDYVYNDEWTLAQLQEMASVVNDDLNADGKYDANDLFGALIWDDTMMGIINASGEKCATIDNETGDITLTLNTERVVDAVTSYLDFVFDNTVCYRYQRKYWNGEMAVSMFMNDQALFFLRLLGDAPSLRQMEKDFGILPYPKLDENQDSYYHTMGSWHSVFLCVPLNAPDVEKTGIILEAMAAESKYTVTPAYYDITLYGKIIRDDESADMLDIILSSRIYDIGWYYEFGGYNGYVMDMLRNSQNNFASMYQKNETKALAEIEEVYDDFLEVANK